MWRRSNGPVRRLAAQHRGSASAGMRSGRMIASSQGSRHEAEMPPVRQSLSQFCLPIRRGPGESVRTSPCTKPETRTGPFLLGSRDLSRLLLGLSWLRNHQQPSPRWYSDVDVPHQLCLGRRSALTQARRAFGSVRGRARHRTTRKCLLRSS